MAQHQVSSVQDTNETGRDYQVIKEFHIDGTFDALYCVGHNVAPGRCRWVVVTAANTNAQKNTAVLAALRA